ncbi:MAG: DNA primase, partial [Gemmatimonadetes bacterium]|nr:DNA primase [Gemmatimonadota bacterium]
MKIPERVIEEIRERTDLVDLIGGYVQLKRSGKNFLGLCPFHQEKTPSFNVSPERNIWHCFGCGETGDCYRFLMEHDRLSFPEAIRALASRAGVDLSAYESGGRGTEEFDLLYRAHEIAEAL